MNYNNKLIFSDVTFENIRLCTILTQVRCVFSPYLYPRTFFNYFYAFI